MSPEGLGALGVMVMLEALGKNEAWESLPARPNAPAGSVLQGILRRLGIDRSQLTLTNTVWCQPPGNWLDGASYEMAAIEHCQQYNKKLVEQRRPRAILAMGGVPFRTLTGMSGYNQGIKMVRGFQTFANRPEYMVDGKSIPVIGTYHPSYLLHASKTRSKDKETGGIGAKIEKAEGGMALSGVIMQDLSLALQIAKTGPLAPHKFRVVKGDREVMETLIRDCILHPEWIITWDIETPRSFEQAADESEIDSIQAQVDQIQFAVNDEVGYVFPGFAAEWVKDGVRRLLALPNVMVTWNGWKFDDKVVQGHHGIPILGRNIDLMSGWHWLQPDLPKGLQFATSFYAPELGPWKHLAMMDETLYGCLDVISLQILYKGIMAGHERRGLATTYDRHVLKLREELVSASKRGFPLDRDKHKAFGERIEQEIAEINVKIQGLVPESILTIEPKKKVKGTNRHEYGYVRTPPQIKHLLDGNGDPVDGRDRIILVEQVPVLDDEENETGQFTESNTTYVRREVQVFNKETLELDNVVRWCRLRPFSVGSVPQKIAYINYKREEEIAVRLARGQNRADAERLAKYKVPVVKNKQKELKENTGSKELERLAKETKDPVFTLFVDITKRKKMFGTYVRGWQYKDREGYWQSPEHLHTTFEPAKTGTGQLASIDVNLQNIPKHSALGKEIRGCIIAKPGKRLLEFDKKAFHAQTLARRAKDKVYARISALDVHSFTTNIRLKLHSAAEMLKMSDKDMGDLFTAQKANETAIFKSESCVAYPDGMTFQQVRDFKSKRVILGIGFCQGPGTLFEQNPESFKDKKEVEDFLSVVKGIIPQVFTFQKEITQLAHKQTYLLGAWGYIRRFYDVFQWDSNKWDAKNGSMGSWRQGDDYEASVAFLPANDAFGMLKEEMLRLAGYRVEPGDPLLDQYLASKQIWPTRVGENLLTKYGFINQIHDSLMFHCDNHLVDACIEDVLRVMREPCLTLADPVMCPGGLFVDAEGSVGDIWNKMDKIKGV